MPHLGKVLETESEEVVHLGGEYGERYACGESYDNGIGDEFDDGAEVEQSHHDQDESGHQCGYGKAFESELAYDAVDYDDEGACGTADLHGVAAEGRHDESAYDGCDQAYGRAYSGCYGECYGERKRHDAHNYAGHEVVLES